MGCQRRESAMRCAMRSRHPGIAQVFLVGLRRWRPVKLPARASGCALAGRRPRPGPSPARAGPGAFPWQRASPCRRRWRREPGRPGRSPKSSAGHRARRRHRARPGGLPPDEPVLVVADRSVVGKTAGAAIVGCAGPLPDVSWTQTAGPAVELLSARTQAISFDPPEPGTLRGSPVSYRPGPAEQRQQPTASRSTTSRWRPPTAASRITRAQRSGGSRAGQRFGPGLAYPGRRAR